MSRAWLAIYNLRKLPGAGRSFAGLNKTPWSGPSLRVMSFLAEYLPWRRKGGDAGARADVEAGAAAGRQAAVSDFMASLAGEDGPTYYDYPLFIQYLADVPLEHPAALRGSFGDTFGAAAKKLLELAGGKVYLADGRAYTPEALAPEFPELSVFRITLAESFAESPVSPGLWVETRRFADLRSLSRMRREIRNTGVADGRQAADVVAELLGLRPARH